jgi:hypothetical protein
MDEDGATMNLQSRTRWLIAVIVLLCATPLAQAHVGNKDIFQRVSAGPYTFYVTIRTPNVIPGVATIEVRVDSSDPAANPVTSVRIAALPLTGPAAVNLPTLDDIKPEPGLPGGYTGSLWLMSPGSWQVHFDVDGKLGHAQAGVPVPAIALSTMTMQRPLGIVLALLGCVLVMGMVGIVAAAVREASNLPGEHSTTVVQRRAIVAGAVTFIAMFVLCLAGNRWWNLSAAAYAEGIYRPLKLQPTLLGNTLHLVIGDDLGALDSVHVHSASDLVLDHGKIMHLYAIRYPQMDVVLHLHPHMTTDWHFEDDLAHDPATPPGTYRLFADIVHRNGFPETLTAELTVPTALPATPTTSPSSDDARATPAPLSAGMLPATDKLPDGYTMIWATPSTLHAGTAYSFHFTLLDPTGKPATNVVPYLGMAGHAAFVKSDFTTFAHTHPDGSAAMPAVMMANDEMPSQMTPSETEMLIPPVVEFPYGFPSPGRYRIFIQMRHGNQTGPGTVETGVFDTNVQ